MIPVILSGGVGSRLWPLSREHHPKQLLALTGEQTMLQSTVQRLQGLSGLQAPIVVCNEAHRFLVKEQLQAIGHNPQAIIVEPVGRNTAPAVALAALWAQQHDPHAPLLVLPADHWMTNLPAFHYAVEVGCAEAARNHLVTFGVTPDRPETGYGYIRAGQLLDSGEASTIAEFVEKPDFNTAVEYLQSGAYYWNSGMFLFQAQQYIDALGQFAPQMLSSCQQAMSTLKQDEQEAFIWPEAAAFRACPEDSIDYAVMERAQNGAVIPLHAGWSDVGSWAALWGLGEKDEQGNVSQGDVLSIDTNNSYIRAEHRLVATLGVENLVVVETADAVMVAHQDRVQDVRKLVKNLKQSARNETELHRCVYRPWGTYEVLEEGERFKVKRIMVKPGAHLSMQMHHHRAEHWIVVKGTAQIECGEQQSLLAENQSTYIPIGTRHRLSNPGRLPLEIIEIQSGSYLEEDDIVRFDDIYGRK